MSNARCAGPGPVPGQALHRDPAPHHAGHGRLCHLRRHRRTAPRPHRRPGSAARGARRRPDGRLRPRPPVRPRDQKAPSRRAHSAGTTRSRRTLGPMATPPPGTIPMVPQALRRLRVGMESAALTHGCEHPVAVAVQVRSRFGFGEMTMTPPDPRNSRIRAGVGQVAVDGARRRWLADFGATGRKWAFESPESRRLLCGPARWGGW
jgi:hypothetical protein